MKTLPSGWKKYKIKDIGTVVTGNTPPKNEPQNYDGDLPWIKPPDLDNGMFVSTSVDTISEFGRKKIRSLPKGSVLVSCIGNIGKVAIAECELCTNQQINSIIPNREIVDPVFIYYTIKRIRPKLEEAASSFVVPLLNKTDFSNIELSFPPLPTQKKIAAVLEKAEKLREWRKEADGLTDRFLKSTFLEMFGDLGKNENGWTEKLLNECIEIPLNSGLSPICSDEIGGIPVFSLANLTDHGLVNNMTKYYYGDQLNKGFDLEIGDILISRSNTKELVGRVGLYKGIPEKVIYPDLMIRIRLDREVLNPIFFEEYLRTDIMRESIQRFAHGTSGSMVKISQKNLMDLQLIIPPIELQQKFASIVQQIEHVRQLQKESNQQIDHFFNVLMQRAFRGELEEK